MITAVYASLLAIWLVFLSFRVIALRGSPVFAFLNINTDDEEMLQRAIRGARQPDGICTNDGDLALPAGDKRNRPINAPRSWTRLSCRSTDARHLLWVYEVEHAIKDRWHSPHSYTIASGGALVGLHCHLVCEVATRSFLTKLWR